LTALALSSGLIAIAPMLAIGADASADVSTIIENYERATVGDAVTVTDLKVSLPHMVIRLTSDTAAPLIVGGETIGFYFNGEGAWILLSKERDERSALKFNAGKAAKLSTREADAGLEVSGKVTRMLIWARASSLPKLDGPPAPGLEESLGRHRERYAHAVIAPASHLFAQQGAPDQGARARGTVALGFVLGLLRGVRAQAASRQTGLRSAV